MKFFKENKLFLITLLVFLGCAIAMLAILAHFKYVEWDEAVYVGVGKYIFSGGNSGFFEITRPVIMPILYGIIWKLHLKTLLFSRILSIVFSFFNIWLVYFIGKKIFNKKTALFSAIIFAFTPLFLQRSSYALTESPSTFFVLLVFYLLLKRKYFWAGLFGGLAFLTRFFQGIYLAAVLGYFILLFIFEKKKKFKKNFFNAARFGVGVFALLIPYFIINYVIYYKKTAVWWHAAFRPIVLATMSLGYTRTVIGSIDYWFYFRGLFFNNPSLALALPGLYFYFKEKLYKKWEHVLLLLFLVFPFIYYTLEAHKELRFILVALPFIALFAGYALERTVNVLSKKKLFKRILVGFVLLILAVAMVVIFRHSMTYDHREMDEYYAFFKNQPIRGDIITTEPILTVYVNNRLHPAYYLDGVLYQLKNIDYSAIYFTPYTFVCADAECEEQRKEMVAKMLEHNNVIYQKDYKGNSYYILSDKEYYSPISKQKIMLEYDMLDLARLSKKPKDRFAVAVVLEDFPSLEEDSAEIWRVEGYNLVMGYMEEKKWPVTLAVVPSQITRINKSQILRMKDFAIIQNGYDHKTELNGGYEEQFSKISSGKQVIKELFGQDVSGYIPPNYATNKHTQSILQELGYDFYLSYKTDPEELIPGMSRYGHTFTLVLNWKEEEMRGLRSMESELSNFRTYDDYMLVSMYYFLYNEDNFDLFEGFFELIEDDRLMTVYELHEWQTLINAVEFSYDNGRIVLKGPESSLSDELTVLIYNSGNFTLESDYRSFYLKNAFGEDLDICINDDCFVLEEDEVKRLELG